MEHFFAIFPDLYPESEDLVKEIYTQLQEYSAFWHTLRDKEYSLLMDFAKSPLQKSNKYIPDLISHLHIALKNNNLYILEHENTIRRYSGGRKTDSLEVHLFKLKEQFKLLLDLIKNFLVHTQAMDNKLVYQRLLVKSLKERSNNELFQKAAAEFRIKLNKTPFTLMTAADKWWLEHQCYYHQYTEQMSETNEFERNLQSLEIFSQLVVLRNYLELLNRNMHGDESDQLNLAVKAVMAQSAANPILIDLYKNMINILSDKAELPSPHYYDFKIGFKKAEHALAKVDQLVLIKACINYLTPVYYQLGDPWLAEVFDWMRYASEKGLYSFEGTISDDEYLNFFSVAQALHEKTVYADFERKYQKLLDPNIKEQVLGLCKTYTLQEHKKIDEALFLLKSIFPLNSKSQLKYDVRAKELRIMLCYENMLLKAKAGETVDDLFKSIDNLQKYCQRQISGKYLKLEATTPHLNFREIASKLYLYHAKNKKSEQQTIMQEIQKLLNKGIPLANRKWLNTQVEALNNNLRGELQKAPPSKTSSS